MLLMYIFFIHYTSNKNLHSYLKFSKTLFHSSILQKVVLVLPRKCKLKNALINLLQYFLRLCYFYRKEGNKSSKFQQKTGDIDVLFSRKRLKQFQYFFILL